MVSDRSNGVYRSVILAVAGLILIGAGGKPAPRADAKQAQAAQPVASKADNTNPTAPKTDKSESKDQGCEQGQDDRQSDLCAQWKAADAATYAARSSDTQTFIGWLGLLLGGTTMGAAIAAALYARRAAVATESTVQIAQDAAKGAGLALDVAGRNADAAVRLADQGEVNARRQLRAYVSVQSAIVYHNVSHTDDESLNPSIVFSLQNHGKTPARIVSCSMGISWFCSADQVGQLFDKNDFPIGFDLFSGDPVKLPIGLNGKADFIDQPGSIIIVGRMNYRDVFDEIHFIGFMFRSKKADYFYDIENGSMLSLTPYDDGKEKI